MISNSITGIDTKGPITNRIDLTNDKGLSIPKMISIVGKMDDKEIEGYFAQKREKPIEERKSLLDEFQL